MICVKKVIIFALVMMIERDIFIELERWKNRVDRSPLIVQGARQIGKSWAITEFGRRAYKQVAVFNFERQKELRSVFEQTNDVNRLLTELELHTTVPIVEGETLIFFDEIQECKAALNSLKYFNEDAPLHHVVAAGSLLGVALRHQVDTASNAFPVGKVDFLNMYPITFKEFLAAANPRLHSQLSQFLTSLEALPDILFNQIAEQYRRYQMCGGLPRVARDLLDGKGMEVVQQDLENLMNAYQLDFSKHVESRDVPRITEIWRSIPSQLSRENKKFVFRVVREGARAREYESALEWLTLSGMIYRVFLTETPRLPLKHYENTTAFKVYALDQAVLLAMSDLPVEAVLAPGELLREFKGAMAENFVLNSLVAQGFKMPHYWTLTGNKAEVDFLIQYGLNIVPIEVKADKNISGQSFAQYDKRYSPRLRVRFSLRNIKKDGNLLNLPIFLCDWLKPILQIIDDND